MSVVGPIQPYAGGGAVQENLGDMIDHILSFAPDVSPQLIKRRLNTRLRQVLDKRMWAGLLVRGQIVIPGVYSTGSVNVTQGSDIVEGIATAWPVDDLVSTTLSTAITMVGEYQDITPASMVGIEAGDWLTFDQAGVNRDYILVISVGPTSFKAVPKKTHSAAETITKSSLVRRQFRVGTTTSFYGIIGVYDDGTPKVKLDLVWGHADFLTSAYQIMQAYVSVEQNLRMVWSVVNNKQGWKIRLNMPQETLNEYDVWRQTTGFVYMMADWVPDEIGRFQYELYPTPSMPQGFPYLAYVTPPNLINNEDTPPPAIPSHILVNGTLGDMLMSNPKSPYYNPVAAAKFESQYQEDLQYAMLADDSVYMQNLQWSVSRYPFSNFGADYHRSHDTGGYW